MTEVRIVVTSMLASEKGWEVVFWGIKNVQYLALGGS